MDVIDAESVSEDEKLTLSRPGPNSFGIPSSAPSLPMPMIVSSCATQKLAYRKIKIIKNLWRIFIRPNADAKARSEAGVAFASFAKGMTASLCRSWAPC